MVCRNLIVVFFSILNYKTTCGQQDSILLKLNLAKGDTLECNYFSTDTIVYESSALSFLFGSEQKEIEKNTLRTLMTVYDIDTAGNYILKAEYVKETIKSRMPSIGEVEYNSDSLNSGKEIFEIKFDEIYRAILSAHVHHPFTIVLSPLGNVVSVAGIEKMLEAYEINIRNSPHLSGSQKKINIERTKKDLSNESVRIGMDATFNVYASGPIAIGSIWQKKVVTGVYEPEVDIYQCQLKKIFGDSLFIDKHANLDSPGDTAKNGTPTKMTGTQSGTMIIDKRSGLALQNLLYVQAKGTAVEAGKVIQLRSSSLKINSILKKPL